MWDIVFLGETARIIRAIYVPIQIYELSASKLHRWRGIFSLQKSLLTGSFLFLHDFFCYMANVQLDKG